MDIEQPIEEPLAPTSPETQVRVKPRRRPDPDGEAWHTEARGRWELAVTRAPEAPIEAFDAPPLPAWSAAAHVRRELFGHFVVDRDTAIVHDVRHALVDCAIDAIRNATFVHFESELPADELVDCTCMGA